MQYSQYRFKFYLNTTHSIYIDGKLGQVHPHTWEITIHTMKTSADFISFAQFEKRIESLLEPFRGVYLNEVAPFTTLNPTLENLTKYFKERFQREMYEVGWMLMSIELAETPTRSYIIDLTHENYLAMPKGSEKLPDITNTIDQSAEQIVARIKNEARVETDEK